MDTPVESGIVATKKRRVNVTSDRPAYYRAYMKRHPEKRRLYQDRYFRKRYSRTAAEMQSDYEYHVMLGGPTDEQRELESMQYAKQVAAENKITTLAETHAELAAFWTTCAKCAQQVKIV